MEEDRSKEKAALFTVMTTSFMVTFMGSSVNLALPAMGHDFGSNAVMTSWIITAYILSSAVFLLPLGRLAVILTPHPIYLFVSVLNVLISLLVPISTFIQMVINLRILQ